MKEKIDKCLMTDPCIDVFITDCRFQNEAKMFFECFPEDVRFFWCNYNDRMSKIDDKHESEEMARQIGKHGFHHMKEITDYMRELVF